ncbi:hypothetical protein Cni_G16313 [Canna indica]|uniref:Legumain prodomain domain-containing protein n=1 Tax=Canna indica TaxID=4628 RepID=A0AAQ3KEU9_9LILI|nr:hypothetical protein Cni_G16313 [Canna indica]
MGRLFLLWALLWSFSLAAPFPRALSAARRASAWDPAIRLPTERTELDGAGNGIKEEDEDAGGTSWALLVAGSNGYGNYRHQADVCHAYRLLKRGGLKEENIVVMMYDDIAHNPLNPRPGTIINHPQGGDVYAGVPKDYTGKEVTSENLYAVLLGIKSAVRGGSGKVIDSKPNDRIFIYYTDHGGPGVLGMPNMPFVFAVDFIEVLKKKHAMNTYKNMVIYVEACESGSIFEGLMPKDINIYVTTASNADESSWGTYCPGMDPAPPPEYFTCLGDLYSVAWMEDSETHNLKETVSKQYEAVKERTSNYNSYGIGSHVMEYGDKNIKSEKLYLYQGFDPAYISENGLRQRMQMGAINQRDADLLYLWKRYEQLNESSGGKKIFMEITEVMVHRMHLDQSIDMIGKLIFGSNRGPSILGATRSSGQPLVDDWDCLKSMVLVFESHCGSLTQYGMKHMRAFANLCNRGISKELLEEASVNSCRNYISAMWSPSIRGFSA